MSAVPSPVGAGPVSAWRWVPKLLRGGLGRLIVGRVLLGVLTLVVVSMLIFGATQGLPGDVTDTILGRGGTPQQRVEIRKELRLDQSVPAQYGHWASRLVLHGDLGHSYTSDEAVSALIGDRIVNSGFLVLISALVCVPFAIALGTASARRRDSRFDKVTSTVVLAVAALPEFTVAIALIALFATTTFQLLPAVTTVLPGQAPWDSAKGLILPIATLTIAVVPYITRIMRASMVEVLEQDYIEMARLKGLPERRVMWVHAARNGIAPAVHATALSLAYLAGGLVIVESIFSYPGIGSALVSSINAHDIPMIQALALLIAAVYIFLNLAADIVTILISPRLRTALR
jgi:peptide/nickel transport system permease protein